MRSRTNVVTVHAQAMTATKLAAIVEAVAAQFDEAETHLTQDGLVVTIPSWRNK